MLDHQIFGSDADCGRKTTHEDQCASAPANSSASGRDDGQGLIESQGRDAVVNLPDLAGAVMGQGRGDTHQQTAHDGNQSPKGGDGQWVSDNHADRAVASIPGDGALPASPDTKTNLNPPAAKDARKGKRRKASHLSKAKDASPSPSTDIDFDALTAALDQPEDSEGKGANVWSNARKAAPPSPDAAPTLAIIGPATAELIKLQRLRRMQIRLTQQINLPAKALVRQWVGYNTFDHPAIAKPRLKRAQDIWSHLTTGKPATLPPEDTEIAAYISQDIAEAKDWLNWIKKRRDSIEAQMERIAATTPAAGFIKATSGLSLKALAVVIAEARCDIETFRNPDRLFKRLGWANGPDNRAQKDCSKIRKAEVFAGLAEPLLKAQSARYEKGDDNKRTDTVTKAAGPYRLIYDRNRAYYDAQNEAGAYAERAAWELTHKKGATAGQKKAWEAGKLTADHLHKRAMRVMLKDVLIDLWRASRGMAPRFGAGPEVAA